MPRVPQPRVEPVGGLRARDRHRVHRQPSPVAAGLRAAVRDRDRRLAEDPTVHLTTNIVGCDPDDVHIGQDVVVRFEQHDDVWLPLFEPTGATDATSWSPNPSARRRARRVSTDRFEHRAVLSGVGRSAIGRRLMVDPLSLTVDACLAAVADAGLTLDDIDGLSTYPGMAGMGMSEGGVTAVEEALRTPADVAQRRRRAARDRAAR